MYKTLTLKNDFHNTSVDLRVRHSGNIGTGDIIKLSAGQVKKAKRELCTKDCQCSGELGTRAQWHRLGSEEVKLSVDIECRDGLHIDGATLAVEQIF